MNERIKELAEQAEMSANKGDHVDVKIMMEKFAELIVRECAGIAQRNSENQTGLAVKTMLALTAIQIEEHFGVE